eukprot:CAMPEP_0170546402 /NCGR_PEP_ID=MMETSP0211-20121228/4755_1 /TAXON_ID=311385 /ORGANISM="Pseudokeronopsis sp., Strain OXSARD2" /LENGTH=215 /DNA_ID=CAMNT_0010850855 /DNA_START=1684 /DNA_END=2331 /DNA_ORIENTATION=+
MEVKYTHTIYNPSYVWNMLKKYLPPQITDSIRQMRCFKDMTGACFDVQEDDIDRFEDIFTHLHKEGRITFEIGRAKSLPELKEDETSGGYSNGGGYNGGGYGRGNYNSGGASRYQGNLRSESRQGGSDSRTVFVGNLGFIDTNEEDIEYFFKDQKLPVQKVRMLKDQDGKFKGAAFVEFRNEDDVKDACRLDGKEFGKQRRRLRINPAGQKPGGR